MALRRPALAVLVACTAAAVLPGLAATLGGVVAQQLGAGDAAVAACDGNGFTVSYTTSAGNVTAVTLGAIADPACEGGMLSLVLAGAGGVSVAAAGPTAVPTDGDAVDNAMTLAVTPTPAAATVTSIHVVVSGP